MKKQEIKNLLGRKNWSVVCTRLFSLVNENNAKEVNFYKTTDRNFLSRKHQKNLTRFDLKNWKAASIISASSSKSQPYFLFAFVK
ncbi:MAG: hypothetical protein ACTSXT_13595 [Candidatus Helarchaeota archaeon]